MLQSGLLKPFPQLLRHHKPNIVKEAAWTLSNITAGTRDQIQMIIGKGLKPKNFGVQGGLVIRPYSWLFIRPLFFRGYRSSWL